MSNGVASYEYDGEWDGGRGYGGRGRGRGRGRGSFGRGRGYYGGYGGRDMYQESGGYDDGEPDVPPPQGSGELHAPTTL